MHLDPAQKATLKANITAKQAAGQPLAGVTDEQVIANHYNAAGTFIVWRTIVLLADIQADAGFDWTRVDNLTVGKARIWDGITRTGSFNPSLSNFRAGISAAWTGVAADTAVQNAILAQCKRASRVLEALFATGTGTTAVPGLLVVEGAINAQEVANVIGGV